MGKVGYKFNRGVSQHTILTLVKSLVPDHDLNKIKPGRVIALRDNALLAHRRAELEEAGVFVGLRETTEASRRQHSGSKGSRGRAGHRSPGTYVNAGLSRPRKPVLVTRDDITLSTWRGLLEFLLQHDASPDGDTLADLTPGDPVTLRPQLSSRLKDALKNYGTIEYRITS